MRPASVVSEHGRKTEAPVSFCSPASGSARLREGVPGICRVDGRFRRYIPPARRPRQAAITSAAASASSATLYEGAVIEVALSSNRRRVAIAQRADGKRNWIVTDAQGIAASIAPRQVTFHLGASDDIGADLAAIEANSERAVAESDGLLEVAWEILASSDGHVQVNEVADVVFGNKAPASMYAAHVMLQRDKTFFKAKLIKGSYVYEPRSEALVQESRSLAEAEKIRAEEQERKRAAVAQSVAKGDIAIAEAALGKEYVAHITSGLIQIAEDSAAFGSDIKAEAAFQALEESAKIAVRFVLGAVARPISPTSAFDVLVAWGVFSPHENLLLRKAEITGDLVHSEEALSSANGLLLHVPVDVDADSRRDLTHLKAYAVDSEDTLEVDDAFSWDSENGMVWVHVADPTRYFENGIEHPLVQEALRRVTTLYLPTAKATMFPEQIATRLFSLGGTDSDGAAVSIGFRVLDNGAIDEDTMAVQCTRISAPQRVTYEQADEMLAQAKDDDDLSVLIQKAEARQRSREKDGAVISNNPFSSVSVQNADSPIPDISLNVVRTDTRAWTLVSELMISACTVAGLYAEDNDVPLIYRGQAPFPKPPASIVEGLPEGPARRAVLFKNAGPSTTGVEPMSHASLGVDAYVQVTSPIRRSNDLIAHFQLKAKLRGEVPPYDVAALSKQIGRENDRGRKLRMLENRTNKYWQMEFLRTQPKGTEHSATFVKYWKEEEKLGIVYLDDYAFDVFLQIPGGVKPGDKLSVVFTHVNPRAGQCRGSVRTTRGESERKLMVIDEVTSDVAAGEAFP